MDPLTLRYDEVARRRPVSLVSAIDQPLVHEDPCHSCLVPLPRPAPYAAVEAVLPEVGEQRLSLVLSGEGLLVRAVHVAGTSWLEVEGPTGTTVLRSRRWGRSGPVDALGLCLTGTHVSVLTRRGATWTGRARGDLSELLPDAGALVRDPDWSAGVHAGHEGTASNLLAGGFGQLGLRDLRLVTHADGTAYEGGTADEGGGGRSWLTATSAGTGPFGTGHTSVWALDRGTLGLTHTADLFFTRPGGRAVHGDHATHLVRDRDRWLVATSTWGDFDRSRDGARVEVTLASSEADLVDGVHVLPTQSLRLPTDGLASVGVWDPYLLRGDEGWLVGYVNATRFFRFHPVLAEGPDLEHLRLRAAATGRTATEGTTLLPRPGAAGGAVVLASDGRDGPRGRRRRFPVLDLDLREVGRLAAAYPSNIPWPTLVPDGPGWLLVTFDDTAHGGRVCGYGTHGDVVVMRGRS